MILKSKVADILLVLYVLLIAYVFWQAQICSGMYCGFIMVIPVLPWPFILEGIIPYAIGNSWYMYVVFLLLNGFILYSLGALIQWSIPKALRRNKL